MKTHKRSAGFSVVELIVTVGLVGIITTAVMGFYVQSLQSGHAVDQQMKLLTTMRTFTEELIFTGSRSHELILYNSADAADRTFANRKVVINDDTESAEDDICPTGNFAVFVFYELPKPAAQAKYRISKLIGYYLESTDSGPPELKCITIDKSSAPSTDTIETLLTDNWSSAPREVIAHRVNALALSDNYTESTVPQLFYRRANQNLAVCGQLLESATRIDTKDRRSYTRTFYFTVTVRS
jgi:Tfp pilus assembly protein PilE